MATLAQLLVAVRKQHQAMDHGAAAPNLVYHHGGVMPATPAGGEQPDPGFTLRGQGQGADLHADLVGDPGYQQDPADPSLGADQPTPPAADGAPNGALFAQLMAKYTKTAGHADQLQGTGGVAQVVDPQAQGLASILSVNKQGARAGQQYATINKDGSKYHLYYTPDGKRQVLKVG